MKIEGDIGIYQSSEKAVRKFCTSCGTPLTFQYAGEAAKANKVWLCRQEEVGPQLHFFVATETGELLQVKTLDICSTTLDTPDAVTPQFHIWVESQRPWFKIADNLPRHPQETS